MKMGRSTLQRLSMRADSLGKAFQLRIAKEV
jgi:hypothetical protein